MLDRPCIMWFRRDLHLADNPALQAACLHGGPVIPLFIWSPEEEKPWIHGAASRWWLHYSLEDLAHQLRGRGTRLFVRTGRPADMLASVIRQTGSQAVYWNRIPEPAAAARDDKVKYALRGLGVRAESFNGQLLHEPTAVLTLEDRPYQVFTPYYRACQSLGEPAAPIKAPTRIPSPPGLDEGPAVAELNLRPRIDWASGLRAEWKPGETGALKRLADFGAAAVAVYVTVRDRPDLAGTSRLSPHLHFGEVSPRQVWYHIRRECEQSGTAAATVEPFLRQLIWREFAHHLLHHFPHTPERPLREDFARFPWAPDPAMLRAWKKGRTGFPIVDAGMRQLWQTGWMHNRVRMIVASFLVKDLLIPWQEGARWFWDTLVDAGLANNTLGWQWIAGCGADAAPYFRIFNPVLQSAKFDPAGTYVRKWIPELAGLPAEFVHEPHRAPPAVLAQAGVELGRNYPRPVIDHGLARERALAAYDAMRAG